MPKSLLRKSSAPAHSGVGGAKSPMMRLTAADGGVGAQIAAVQSSGSTRQLPWLPQSATVSASASRRSSGASTTASGKSSGGARGSNSRGNRGSSSGGKATLRHSASERGTSGSRTPGAIARAAKRQERRKAKDVAQAEKRVIVDVTSLSPGQVRRKARSRGGRGHAQKGKHRRPSRRGEEGDEASPQARRRSILGLADGVARMGRRRSSTMRIEDLKAAPVPESSSSSSV